MIEAAAKEKWCPFVRPVIGNGQMILPKGREPIRSEPYNAVVGAEDHCIGAQCMAWRWETYVRYGKMPEISPTRGYCGLAGAPQ